MQLGLTPQGSVMSCVVWGEFRWSPLLAKSDWLWMCLRNGFKMWHNL